MIPFDAPVLLGSVAEDKMVVDEEDEEDEEEAALDELATEEGATAMPRCVIPLKISGTSPPETSPSKELKKVRSSWIASARLTSSAEPRYRAASFPCCRTSFVQSTAPLEVLRERRWRGIC